MLLTATVRKLLQEQENNKNTNKRIHKYVGQTSVTAAADYIDLHVWRKNCIDNNTIFH
jgi:hypothetical protein